MRQIQFLQLFQPPEALRHRSDEGVPTRVHQRCVAQQSDLRRQASAEIIVEENDLVERAPHLPDARRNAPAELVVGEHDHGSGGVAEVGRNRSGETVVVQENGVEVFVKEGRRHRALELVESQIEVLERRQAEEDFRKFPDEAVVTDIEFVEELEAGEALGDDTAEAVGIDVEECDIIEEAELFREMSGDVGAIEVDAGDHIDRRVVERGSTKHTSVGAEIAAMPIPGVVLGV